ncbi:MAG: hypothetical protein KAU62_16940, partial [Candidatus Heimdallarchaeota archaeon]|nr:hypothetical protein [Candidatus Heimdallarchaeota archaeon]MCK4612845.1 hypothetical protein [Candidatus Heimdallarchaeota archaeon]
MSARKKTETLDVTNWMSFIHHMYGAALHMGPYNYACIQLALEFWDYYAEVNFLRDQKHIIYFVAGAFRCTNKYAYRGGITHFSRKGQENAEYLMSSALKIESASYGLQMQPAITPVPFSKVKVDSWENRLAALAVDMILNPENDEYIDGYLLDPEEADSSPLANMTLKIYLQILQRAINYEKKRKVIGQLSETKNEINEYIKEIRKETQEYFDEAKEEYTLMRIQLLQSKEDLIQFKNEADSMKQEINEVNDSIKQEINEAK